MASASPRRFRFGRTAREAGPGETVLAALSRDGWPSVVRSVRYHRPRGPFCGVGDCTGCLVRLNGVPNQRACRREVQDGDVVRTENSWPSPRHDLFGALDLLLPRGLDTVHGLRRPEALRRIYQRVVRRLAGFGEPPELVGRSSPPAATSRTAEVLIVGAGRSGRAVAEALVRAGRRPLVVDRSAATLSGGADLLDHATVTLLAPPAGPSGTFTAVGFDARGAGVVVRAPAVVVATGSYDAALLFEGCDRPGVVTADLALGPAELPLGPSVIVGDGRRAEAVVARLADEVVGVVAFGEIGPELVAAAAERGIALYPRSRVVRALGRGHLRGVEIARRDGGGRYRLACSSIVLAHRRLPNAQLLFQAGAARRWSELPGAYYPELDGDGRTGVVGLYAVGSAAGPAGPAAPTPAGVAAAIAAGPQPSTPAEPAAPVRVGLRPYYAELLREPRRGKWVLCPCEDVLLEEVERASRRGYRGLEVIKRYTGVGTGLCQGRYCLPEAILVLANLERREPTEVGYITQRPPVVPTPLGALASVAGELERSPAP